MPLPVPDLDDRDFATLLAQAKALIPARCPDWTDLSPSDPGITLLELFAFLTETMLYRLNRLPEKAFMQFLNLVGVRLQPPSCAAAELTFSLPLAPTSAVRIPLGTRVSTGGGGDAPTFVTIADVTIDVGATSVTAVAVAGELVEAEHIGTGTGLPSQQVRVGRPPVALDAIDHRGLVIGVEAEPAELEDRAPTTQVDGRWFRLWTQVDHFGVLDSRTGVADRFVYVADRAEGTILFAPAVRRPDPAGSNGELSMAPELLGEVPAAGRRVMAWYRHGGGADGNVTANTLVVVKDPVAGAPGLKVTNEQAASGGRAAESLDNALVRGPASLSSLDRVVTARDYELLACSASGGVARAKAMATGSLWAGATPGEVSLLLVPTLGTEDPTQADAAEIKSHQSPETVQTVVDALAERETLGTRTRVGWAGVKTFHVEATVVVHVAEDRDAIRRRLLTRLAEATSPVPGAAGGGWPFGQALRSSAVYDVLLSERGVRYAEQVRLVAEEVPAQIQVLLRDPNQQSMWFAGSGSRMFRSSDDAKGWELLADFDGEKIERVVACGPAPGLLLAASRIGDTDSSRLRQSTDFGESWRMLAELDFHVEDVTLTPDRAPIAFLASDRGLLSITLDDGAVPLPVLVDATAPAKPFYAVEAFRDDGGQLRVAAAAQELGGVYVSFQDGRAGTFQDTGLSGTDVRVLQVQAIGPRRFLLAGCYATGDDPGYGVVRLELRGPQPDPQGWVLAGGDWSAGSCLALGTIGETIIAATSRAGVAVCDPSTDSGRWRTPPVDCGLPLRDPGRFEPVTAIAVANDPLVLAGGPAGVRSSNDVSTWSPASERVFTESITLPPTWLFAAGDHQLVVVTEGAR